MDIVSQDDRLDFYLRINGVQTYVGGFRPLVSGQGGYGFHIAKVTPGTPHDQSAPLELRAENFSTIRRGGEQSEVALGTNDNANFAVVPVAGSGARLEVRDQGDQYGIELDYRTKGTPRITTNGPQPIRLSPNNTERVRVDVAAAGVETAIAVWTDGRMAQVKIGPVGSGPGGYGRALWIEP